MDRPGAVRRRSRTSCRTSATARSPTPAAWRSGPRSPPASNITFKLLLNSAVAMTGGQQPMGELPVAELHAPAARPRASREIVVTTDDPALRRRRRSAAGADVWHRDDLIEAAAELARDRRA